VHAFILDLDFQFHFSSLLRSDNSFNYRERTFHCELTYLEDVCREIVERLKVKYEDRLLSIVLFGSTAQGRRKLESDLDVIVILTDATESDRNVRSGLENIMIEYEIPIDSLVFTVDEFKYMLDQKHPLILGVLLGYKVIYDRLGVSELLNEVEASLREEGWRRYKWSGLWIKPKH